MERDTTTAMSWLYILFFLYVLWTSIPLYPLSICKLHERLITGTGTEVHLELDL